MSLHVLAIDTTGEFGSIALVGEMGMIEEVALDSPDGFAHVLFGEIERLLARHGLGIEQVDAFASAAGPGSFTGVRVGLTAVKGLAEATGRKVAAVSNLEALAWFGSRPLRAAVLDARRGEVYGGVYDAALRPVQEEVVAKIEDWLAGLPGGDLEIVTHGLRLEGESRPVVEAPRSLAGSIGHIAFDRLGRGEVLDPAEIDANYVRRSDAELLWKDAWRGLPR
ncbi:MAG: tRNA (adenosine(37)-N6)-threonylcarbamoyltransferase complex dimerization subunit type 1 TsaB [Acidobacteriota bacterium]|nr:tRNA (adenosine(37)-N6)-threonylcarbamoyltransferase complex dimerization subunit type 1 TsaB [Acidobacteriota bacterium]